MPASRDPIYRRRGYSRQLIEQCVRWYLTYRLGYRDLAAMMAEREVTVSHTTIMRWVRHYVLEYERRWSRFSKPTHSSWRMDETAVSVGGRWNYLYRAVDRNGKSVHSLLREDRTIGSAQEFFRPAVKVRGSIWPERINLDGNAASHLGLRLLGKEDSRWRSVQVRARRYLNNVIEQDHRAIKQRSRPMLGLKSFHTAAVTFSGIELAHRIRKRQFTVAYERKGRVLSLKNLWDQALSGKSFLDSVDHCPPPLMRQISRRSRPPRRARRGRNDVVRYRRRVSFGQSLYFQVSPKGRRYWHYRYRFEGRQRQLSLGRFPYVPVESAWARRHAARHCLKRASIPAARSRRCVESSSIVSDQISRKPSYRNDAFRPRLRQSRSRNSGPERGRSDFWRHVVLCPAA
jgi:transposase-like protein